MTLQELCQGTSSRGYQNSRQPFNSVHYVNVLYALPSILRYYLPCKNRPVFEDYQSGKGDKEQRSICNVTVESFSAVTRHRAAA